MTGNSLKWDGLPIIELRGWVVHIPYEITWFMEHLKMSSERPARQLVTDSVYNIPGNVEKIT